MAKNRMTFEKHQRDAKKKRKAEEKRAMRKKKKEQAEAGPVDSATVPEAPPAEETPES